MSEYAPSPEDIVQAHQYLYYVHARPIWTDFEYDRFCKKHGIEGGGGSDLENDYPLHVKILANRMRAEPSNFPAP